ncbi:hypothetical protein PI124_g7768 [Phytophthora idaei]|nr:hypothetical protein PI126_g6960 [Phytophthora idaei]KAG3247524.1 hypothetical protein PI124_g7768 [Phytophthora idaei]
MPIKILATLPGYLWGSGMKFQSADFTVKKMEQKLVAIFSSKSKAQMMTLDNSIGCDPRTGRGWCQADGKCTG